MEEMKRKETKKVTCIAKKYIYIYIYIVFRNLIVRTIGELL